MFRTDDMYGDYPTLEEIKRDFNELIEMVGNVTTIEQAQEWEDKFTIEINGLYIDEFVNGIKLSDGTRDSMHGKNASIEWIRYEAYGCLAYVYFYIKNGIVDDIVFDVWSNKHDATFIADTSIDNVIANYDRYVDIVELAYKDYFD